MSSSLEGSLDLVDALSDCAGASPCGLKRRAARGGVAIEAELEEEGSGLCEWACEWFEEEERVTRVDFLSWALIFGMDEAVKGKGRE